MPRVQLASDIHMVRVRDDIVVLDIASDRYSCLVGAASALTLLGAGEVEADASVLRELGSAGFLTRGINTAPRREPVVPTTELFRIGGIDAYTLCSTAVRTLAVTRQFRSLALSALVAAPSRVSKPDRVSALKRVATRTSAYRAVLPFLPFEGLCLQRAYQLRQLLAQDGTPVDWVFGVRTWPFFAHCWLQSGAQVIGDRLDRVRAFTPIAVF